MNYPENNLGQFITTHDTLDGGSIVHNVHYLTPYGSEPVAAPPSRKCADELALALEHVRHAYLDCGSDVAVSLLSIKLIRALEG